MFPISKTFAMPGTLEQIASALGISISTVSRALAGKPGVSPDKRRRIQELASQLGFVPDQNASSLRTGRGHGMAIITPFQPSRIALMRNNALFTFGQKRFQHVRMLVQSDSEPLDSLVRQAAALHPEAIVISGISGEIGEASRDMLHQKRIAVTVMDATVSGVDLVAVDRITGIYQATRLLLLSDCRHIIFFCSASLERPDDRIRGILQAYQSLKRPTSEIEIAHVSGNGFKPGFQLTNEIIRSRPLDGLFCYNDEMAIGALKALHDAGIRVPEEVKVVGFDNLSLAEYLPCPLTTVAQPVDDIAQAAVSLCEARLANPESPLRTMVFPTQLLVRATATIRSHEQRVQVFNTPSKKDDQPTSEQ